MVMWQRPILLASSAVLVAAAAAGFAPRSGAAVLITTDREMEEHGNRPESGSGSSTDRDSYVERVVASRPDGVVLDYDLPRGTPSDPRAGAWQFPFQLLRRADGSLQLLNAPALNRRVDRWLKGAGLTRAACGTQVFTWNAFRIECDPESVVAWAASMTLPDRLAAGSPVSDPDTRSPARLRQASADTLTATLPVDPATIRRRRAHDEVDVAALMRKPLMLDAALKAQEAETVTGTVAITFDLDPAGVTRKRTRVEVVHVAWPDGRVDTRTVTETLKRDSFPAGADRP